VLQKRISSYLYMTYDIYDKFGNVSSMRIDPSLQEIRLQPYVYYVEKMHNKTDAVIFGSHDDNTPAMVTNISDYLDTRWGAKTENYVMYYLNGQDNSLSLITTQPLRELASRFQESYLTPSVEERSAEMLQQANMLDERESFLGLRKQRFRNVYSFSRLTNFNQSRHQAIVIAFVLPIDDIILANMALSRFLLEPSNIDYDRDTSRKRSQHLCDDHWQLGRIQRIASRYAVEGSLPRFSTQSGFRSAAQQYLINIY